MNSYAATEDIVRELWLTVFVSMFDETLCVRTAAIAANEAVNAFDTAFCVKGTIQ